MSVFDKLKSFTPLDTLTEAGLKQLWEDIEIRHIQTGDVLFHAGEIDSHTYYLLEGTIRLATGGQDAPLLINGGSDSARHPLARLKPRRYQAVAATNAIVVVIDDDDLDNLLTTDQTAAYVVTELDVDDPEWMFRLLTPPAFQRVPTANLAALFARLQPVSVKAGEVVLSQGEVGDYYYLIKEGRTRVMRRQGGQDVPLAELDIGQGFGEEALLSGEPRNATVTMLTDGTLMRLSKDDFNQILKEPMVQWITMRQAASMVKAGAGLVDVRLEDEYRESTLAGSINIPLYLLRLKAKSLHQKHKYILFCQTDRRSCTAAFLLTQRGFDVYVIKGGLNGIREAQS